MATGRAYMRGLCITFNLLLLICGGFLLVVGLTYTFKQTSEFDHRMTTDVYVLTVFGLLTVLFSLLGACSAFLHRKLALILYAVFMTAELISLIIITVPLIHIQPKMGEVLEERFRSQVPLHGAEPPVLRELNKLQASDECCGLQDHSDWGDQVPASCLCRPPHPGCVTVELTLEEVTDSPHIGRPTASLSQALWVYSKPCGPILKRHMDFLIQVMIGLVSAFATLMVAAILLSVVLGLEGLWQPSPPPPPPPPPPTLSHSPRRVKHQLSPHSLA